MTTTKVTLRKRVLPSGKVTLYLDYYPAVRDPKTMTYCRHEYLGIYLVKDPRSKLDRETNAEKVRKAEAIRAKRELSLINEQYGFIDKSRQKMSFLTYFDRLRKEHGQTWNQTYLHFEKFCNGACLVSEVTLPFCRRFRDYLETAESLGKVKKPISINTQVTYWDSFRFVLKRAYADNLLIEDITPHLEPLKKEEVHREFLTLEELRRLADAPCRNDTVKRASLFSCLTGLRRSDILALDWSNLRIHPDGGHAISIRTKKTRADALLPISDEAYELCGEPGDGLVFKDLNETQISRSLPGWLKAAGISKHISFHCFRHTYATLLASSGVPIYTVSELLTHKNVSTTQIYAHLVDENKRNASNTIKLKAPEEE